MFDQDYLILPYLGGVPGADSATYVLYDSTQVAADTPSKNPLQQYRLYCLSIKNPNVCTLKAYGSTNGGQSWVPFYQLAVPAATATANNEIAIPVQPHQNVRVELINGGLSQASGWYLAQGLDNGQSASRPSFFDANSDIDPGDVTVVTSPQLPSSLGQKVKASSLSVVQASDTYGPATMANSQPVTPSTDHPITKVANMRAPLKGEVLPITVTTASQAFAPPAAWLGKLVRFEADGDNLFVQLSTDTTASVDKAAVCGTSGGPPLVIGSSPTGACFKIPNGQYVDIPFAANIQSFAMQMASISAIARTHLAET
jgi:hypothetical protein